MSEQRIFHRSQGIPGAAAWLMLSASAALVGSIGFNSARALAQPGTGSAAVSTKSSTPQDGEERPAIEALVNHLHDSLKITAEQEPLWHDVTNVMRENAETMSRLGQARAEHAQTATAIDDLKSYAQISEAHAVATKRMIPVFQALYDSMSPEQKKATDAEFRGRLQENAHDAK